VDKGYPNLFGESVERDNDEGASENIESVFSKHYGWIYSATAVADHERITLDQAFELPLIQFLNDLAYLKMKRKVEEAQMERLTKKK